MCVCVCACVCAYVCVCMCVRACVSACVRVSNRENQFFDQLLGLEMSVFTPPHPPSTLAITENRIQDNGHNLSKDGTLQGARSLISSDKAAKNWVYRHTSPLRGSRLHLRLSHSDDCYKSPYQSKPDWWRLTCLFLVGSSSAADR